MARRRRQDRGGLRAVLLCVLGLAAACSARDPEEAAPPPSSPAEEPVAVPVRGDAARAEELCRQALSAERRGRAEEQAALFEAALEADPACVPALVGFGFYLLESQRDLNQGRALLLFRQARALEPGLAEALCGEALARHALGESARAEPLLRECLDRPELQSRADRLAQVEASLAELLHTRHEDDRAEEHYRKALQLAPARRSVKILVAYGTFLAQQGRREEAEALMRRAIALNPLQVTAHYQLQSLLQRRGAGEEAAKERRIHEILRQLSDHTSNFYTRDLERRVHLRRELVEAYPEYRDGPLDLVRELLGARRYEEAGQETRALLDARGPDAELYYLAARAAAGAGRLAEARDAAHAMRRANPEVPEAVLQDILEEWRGGQDRQVSEEEYRSILEEWKQSTVP